MNDLILYIIAAVAGALMFGIALFYDHTTTRKR